MKNIDASKTVDAYILQFSDEMQRRMREIIRNAAPDAREIMSWGMSTYKGNKNIMHFAGHKNHIGFYPGENGAHVLLCELKDYKTAKGAIPLPNREQPPLELIKKITEYRVKEDKNK